MTKKTAKKTTTKKTTKKTAKKSAKKSAKASAAATPAAALQGMHSALEGLLDEIQSLGLVTTDDADTLSAALEDLPGGTLSQGLKSAAKWETRLTKSLARFRAQGGDGKLSAVHESLLVWQRTLTGLRADRPGVEKALTAFQRVIPFSGSTVFLKDHSGQRVAPYLSHGFEVDLISRVAFDTGRGFSSWVAGRRKPILYSSLHRNEAPQADVVRSFMAVPLVVADDCVGVWTLGHGEDGAYKPSALRIMMVAGAMLAGLIQRMRADREVARLQINDPLTGLLTAGHVESRLKEEVVRCRELGYSMTLAALELPELAGHAARFGAEYRQRALAEAGALIQEYLQEPEMAGIVDNDRILLILPGLGGGERAQERLTGLTRILEAHSFPRRKRMTTRVAVAAYPADAESSQDLMSYADRTLEDLQLASGSGSPTASLEAA